MYADESIILDGQGEREKVREGGDYLSSLTRKEDLYSVRWVIEKGHKTETLVKCF